jgi:transposase
VSVVIGLDQHRAQISAEWIETITGEVPRADRPRCPSRRPQVPHAVQGRGFGGGADQIYGVGELTAVTILAELGEARRFQNPREVVRYAGLDITVYQSDNHRAPGHLSRQGPPALRWALYEAAQRARFPASPDRPYYEQLAARIGGNRACLALARKPLKRSYHLLKTLGDQALAPVA